MTKINVTRSFLPPFDEYAAYLRQIWKNDHLTNQGPLLKEFEKKTTEYLGVSNFQFLTNGTLALQIALRALGITEGEIITTPFTYVATTSAILWERCTPVYVDIEPETFCIDANKIEAAITINTKAIMAVHVFGFPCDTEKIEAIAAKHNLKVIYDAAHAFGAEYKGKSLLGYGDISMSSFHATKLFHTIEGGSLTVKDQTVCDKVELLKRFGQDGEEQVMLGINAKASEFQAAMGLANLRHVDEIIEKRKAICRLYDDLLGNKFKTPEIKNDTKRNYAYYPVLFKDEQQLLKAAEALNQQAIFPRRYFYPSLNKLKYLKNNQSCPISEGIASRILCLPLYYGLKSETISKICEMLKS